MAQTKLNKTSQSIDVVKDVVVDLTTNYVEIEVDTWNRNEVSIEAYLESEKLSKEDLEKALKAWNLKVDASTDYVNISSQGGRSFTVVTSGSYDDILKDLEFELADIPKMPEFPEMPEMPEMPEFPELPELPKGINTIKFDYSRYEKEGEKYLEEWSKRYEKEGGKELQERMEAWAEKFAGSDYQKKMQEWGESYGKRFEGKWTKDMEKWGEKFGEKFGKSFGKDMEKWGEEFGEKFGKDMEKWGEEFGRRFEKEMEQEVERTERRAELEARKSERSAKLFEERAKREEELAKRRQELQRRKSATWARGFNGEYSKDKLKKVIKIKMPKKAKLKLNVRHGELKIASLLNNVQGDIAHAFVVAKHIDGSDTSINVSYSPIIVDTWTLGTLNLNFVDKAQIKMASNLMLNSKSSNVLIDSVSDTAIIDGSFGDLTISNLEESFKNLNLVLENTDALVDLPDGIDYNLYFKGNRSKFNNSPTSQKTVRKDANGQSSNRNIIVNAKFSNVIMD